MWAGSHIKGAINPKRILVKNKEEYNNFIKTYDGKMNVYTSVYDYEYFSENRGLEYSVILDRIFIDLDAHEGDYKEAFLSLKKLHVWFNKENIYHEMAFSGRGFYIFAYGERASSIREIKAYFDMCHDIISGSPCLDKSVINNARLRRVINTYHMQAGRWCIPLYPNDLGGENDTSGKLEEIIALSESGPRNKIGKLETKSDGLIVWPEVRYFDAMEVEITETESPGKLPIIPCLKNAIMVENPNHRSRVLLVQWYNEILSELAILDNFEDGFYSPRDVNGVVLLNIMNNIQEEIGRIASNEDIWIDYNKNTTRNHVEYIVNKRYMAPSCHTLIQEGYCVGKCWRYT